jgi:hypothetical protein
MALGQHLQAGAIGRELRDKSRAWLDTNFPLVAKEPSFLQLPASEVAALVGPDELEAKEEDVFGGVLGWVKEDEAGRKAELTQLLPLVRFPMMAQPGPAMMAEPLTAQHPLFFQLLAETHPDFAESGEKDARLAQKLGQPTSAFYRCIPTGVHGPTGIVWANLTPFSRGQRWRRPAPGGGRARGSGWAGCKRCRR